MAFSPVRRFGNTPGALHWFCRFSPPYLVLKAVEFSVSQGVGNLDRSVKRAAKDIA